MGETSFYVQKKLEAFEPETEKGLGRKKPSKPNFARGPPEYITQKQLGPWIREMLGIPLGDSTIIKKCSPAIGGGPPVAAWIGKRPLYRPDDALAWAKSFLTDSKQENRRRE
jgi:hypothetical protein